MNEMTRNLNTLSARAWILPFGNELYTAISEFEIVHILAGRQRYTLVPRSPLWCRYVFVWCDQLITLFDLNVYINPSQSGKSISDFSSDDIVCVVSYKDRNSTLQYGSLILSSLPVTRNVTDNQMCNFPSGKTDWSKMAISCFEDPEFGAVPVLDIQRIFCPSTSKPDI